MPGEAAVPADVGDLVFGGHGSQLRAVELLQEAPDVVHGPEEEDVRVHIEQRVHILQDDLRSKQQHSDRLSAAPRCSLRA